MARNCLKIANSLCCAFHFKSEFKYRGSPTWLMCVQVGDFHITRFFSSPKICVRRVTSVVCFTPSWVGSKASWSKRLFILGWSIFYSPWKFLDLHSKIGSIPNNFYLKIAKQVFRKGAWESVKNLHGHKSANMITTLNSNMNLVR